MPANIWNTYDAVEACKQYCEKRQYTVGSCKLYRAVSNLWVTLHIYL